MFFGISPIYAQKDELNRSLFVSVLDPHFVLNDKTQIDPLIDFSKQAGIKTLFVQIYRANKAWFSSKFADQEPYQMGLKSVGQDPLALLIKKAHEAGIEVHVWLNLLSLSANAHAPILKKYGLEILVRNKEIKTSLEDYKIDNQYFLEPSDPRVKKELLSIISEILRQYKNLDGILFDYIRYPDQHPFYGYSKINMDAFKRATGKKEIVEEDPVWKQWKRDNVTRLLQALVKKVRFMQPKMHVSNAGCVSYVRTYHEALQDWPTWLNSHLVESVTMMNYPIELSEYQKNVHILQTKVNDFSKVNLAVGAYKFINSPEGFYEQFKYCKEVKAMGCAVFYYGSIQKNPAIGEFLIKDYRDTQR